VAIDWNDTKKRQALQEALEKSYPSASQLEIFVDIALNENLENIVGDNHNLRQKTYYLIKWARSKNRLGEIFEAFKKENSGCDVTKIIEGQTIDFTENELTLELDPNIWGVDVYSGELEMFLPQQFSFEADVGNLQQGLQLANAVCKITFADRPTTESGTGVLVAPGFVLTNYHVLTSQGVMNLNEIVQSARFEFGYIGSQFGESVYTQIMKAAEMHPIVASSSVEELDYALIQLSPSENFVTQPVPLNTTAKLLPRSPLNILQHPEGSEMKVSLSNNGVVKTNEEKGLVLYVNSTKRGSSGSPCFDNDWKLVALHHKKKQTSFGSLREGILFSAIYRHIQKSVSVVIF
jgi:endonuclease G, mitochondrial